MMAERYPNPEHSWHLERDLVAPDPSFVTNRIGRFEGSIVPLSGGLANQTFRLGTDRVLRLYLRDKDVMTKEVALLTHPWESFRTPQVYDQGDDYLILEYVAHGALENTAQQGRAVGAALAEIHRFPADQSGFFDDNFRVVKPLGDFVPGAIDYLDTLLAKKTDIPLLNGLKTLLVNARDTLAPFTQEAVRLHGDFKPSNLHWTEHDQLLILDWEFTYAGPALMDVGQLARWGMPEPFRNAFEITYRENGGQLDPQWRPVAEQLDIINLAGLLAASERNSVRHADLESRITQLIGQSQFR